MRKTYLGSRSSSLRARDELDKDLRKYQQETGQDYYFDKQQFENQRNPEDPFSISEYLSDHFEEISTGAATGAALGAYAGGPIGAGIGGTVGGLVGAFTDFNDVANSMRILSERWVDGKISSDKTMLANLSQENKDLQDIETYYNLIDEYKQKKDLVEKQKILEEIQEWDKYFLSEGRSHVAIAQLLFDKNLVPKEYRKDVDLAELAQYATQNDSKYDDYNDVKSISDLWQNAKTFLGNIGTTVSNAAGHLGNIMSYAANLIDGRKYISNNAVMSSANNPNSYIEPYIKFMYKGGIKSAPGLNEYTDISKSDREKLEQWKEFNDNKFKELSWDYKANEWAKRTGSMRIPFSRHLEQMWNDPSKLLNFVPFADAKEFSQEGGLWVNNVWDPNDVSDEWRAAQQQHSGEFWHPWYMLPELGSTLGLAGGMVKTIGLNAVSNYIIRKLPVVAASLADRSKSVKYGGQALSYLADAIGSAKAATAVRAAEIGKTFDILSEQRKLETAQEAEEAMSQRFLKEIQSNGTNLENAFSKIIKFAQTELNLDTSKMEPQDLAGLALAYDIQTGDPAFEEAKKVSQNGISKLINANNALALHDYLEVLPWLSYGGQVMNKFSNAVTKFMNKNYIPVVPTKGYMQSPNALWNDILNNYKAGVNAAAIRRVQPRIGKLAEDYADALMTAKNSFVDRLAGYFIAHDAKKLGLQFKHTADYAKDIAKKSLMTGAVEGVEEGQQQVLQQRFGEGLYDEYNAPYSIFNLSDALQNLELGKYSIEALFGMHDHGDDEIRKAMAIGFFISPLMGVGMNAVTNVSSSEYNNNLRNLIGQLRTDGVLSKMVGENFKAQDDTEHMSIFYDMFKKNRISAVKLARALNDLKLGVDEQNSLVEKKYIDDDIKHVSALWTLYNDENYEKDLADKGIVKNSEKYKNAIIKGATKLVDAETAGDLLVEQLYNITKNFGVKKDLILTLLDPNVAQSRKDNIRTNNPELAQTYDILYNYYQKYKKALTDFRNNSRQNRLDTYSKLSNEQLAKIGQESGHTLFNIYLTKSGIQGRELSIQDSILALEDENTRNEFLEYIVDKDLVQDERSIFESVMDAWYVMQKQHAINGLISEIENRKEHLTKFQKLFGRDLDLYKINGYVESLRRLKTKYDDSAKKYLKARNSWVNILNSELPESDKIKLTDTLDDFFSSVPGLDMDSEQSLTADLQNMMMMTAAAENLQILADAILHRDKHSPDEFVRALYSKDEGGEFMKELAEKYKKLEEQKSGIDEMDLVAGTDLDEEQRNLRKEAAMRYILSEIDNDERRKLVAHAGLIQGEIDTIEEPQEPDPVVQPPVEEPVVSEPETTQEEPAPETTTEPEPAVQPEPVIQEPSPEIKVDEDPADFGEQNENVPDFQNDEPAPDIDINEGAPQIDINEGAPQFDINEGAPQINIDEGKPQIDTNEGAPQIDTNEGNPEIILSELDFINGVWMHGGSVVDPEAIAAILGIQDTLSSIDHGALMSAYSRPGRSNSREDSQTQADLARGDLLSCTFFYNPDPRDENGNPTDKPIDLTVGGEQVKLRYELRSNRELAKKLLIPNWFKNANKYYIVTQNQAAQEYFEKNKDKRFSSEEIADTFTVALIIEDDSDKTCYATTLRGLGKYDAEWKAKNKINGKPLIDEKTGKQKIETIPINEERDERERYELHGVRRPGESKESALERMYDEATKILVAQYYIQTGQNLSEETAGYMVRGTHQFSKRPGESDSEYQRRKRDAELAIRNAKQTAREHLSKTGQVLSYPEIDAMIAKLHNNRMAIINAYLTKNNEEWVFPSEVRTSIKPDPNATSISNGKFDNIKHDDKLPKLTILSRDDNPFGIPTDIQGISEAITNGSLRIGFGRGLENAANPYYIDDIREGFGNHYENGGIAGKIFLSVRTVNGTMVPMMLIEQRLNTQHGSDPIPSRVNENNVKLVIDPDTGEIVGDATRKPSMAEALLYMLFGKLNPKYIPGDPRMSAQVQRQFADLIIHNSPKTILKNQKVEDQLQHYAEKQLAIVDGKLKIALPTFLENGSIKYHLETIDPVTLFSDKDLRQRVVGAIADQFHWNTDRKTMNQKFGEQNTKLITQSLMGFFSRNSDQKEFSIAGIPEFTFNKEDLFQLDTDGTPIRVIPNTTVLAWMIKTGRLLTDVSNDVFYAPWVYASGVESTPISVDPIVPERKDGVVDIEELLNAQEALKSLTKKISKLPQLNDKSAYEMYVTEEDRRHGSSEKYKKYGARIKSIMLDMALDNSGKYTDIKDFKAAIVAKVEKLVNLLEEHQDQLKLKPGAKITMDPEIEYPLLLDAAMQTANGKKGKLAVPIVEVYESGHVEIRLENYAGAGNLMQSYVNGVFSTADQIGVFDEKSAREWLNKKLGIQQHQILVTDAIIRSVKYEDVYGMMELIYDSLDEEEQALFTFRRDGGRGLPYHEAWHYVNLLMHNRQQRAKLYKEYVEVNNLQDKHYTNKQVEELMAEDFRNKEERWTDRPISSKIKRFFRSVGEFLKIVGKHPAYEDVYYNIHRGLYKNTNLDKESLQAFKKRYKGFVFSGLEIPSLNRQTQDNIAHVIKDTKTFYDVGNAIVDYALNCDIDTIEKLTALLREEGFKAFRKQLEQLTERLPEQKAALIKAFIDNPDALFHMLASRFKDLGLGIKKNKHASKDKEKDNENQFDRYQVTIPRKQSVGFLVKLFLRQIPKSYWDYSMGEPIYVEKGNSIFPQITEYMPFDEAWYLVTRNLGECNSYGDFQRDANGNIVTDGNGNAVYDQNSIRGIVKRLAKSQTFFEALDAKLDEIEDNSDLKSQIYSTVNSQTPNMSYYQLATRLRTEAALAGMDDVLASMPAEEVQAYVQRVESQMLSDRNKQWILRNDNTLRAARNIPRKWSQSLLMQGLIDRAAGDFKISKNFAKQLIKLQKSVRSKISGGSSVQEVKDAVLKLLNTLGVTSDRQTLDYFIQLDFDRSGDEMSDANIKKHLGDLVCTKTAGTFGYFIALINENVGNLSYKNHPMGIGRKLNDEIEIERTFVGTKMNSKVTKMALAYNAIHPSTEEYAVRMPSGEMGYPNTQNNTLSTSFRLLNSTNGKRALELRRSKYARHSLILDAAKDFDENTPQENKFKLNLNIGMDSDSVQKGADFFGITALEDYIINMMLLDQDPTFGVDDKNPFNNEFTNLITPVMADKKMHFHVQTKSIQTVHDCVLGYVDSAVRSKFVEKVYGEEADNLVTQFKIDNPEATADQVSKVRNEFISQKTKELEESGDVLVRSDKDFSYRRFSDNTLSLFANYMLDELDALIYYYSKKHIKYMVEHPDKANKNYDASIKDGRLQFDGNGGLFRYFYDVLSFSRAETKINEDGKEILDENNNPVLVPATNLNQWLEGLWKLQKQIESGQIKDSRTGEDVGLRDIDSSLNIDNVDDVDGFELIRLKLQQLKDKLFVNGYASETLLANINGKLINMTLDELDEVSTNPNWILASKNQNGIYIPYSVPAQLLERQAKRFQKKGHPRAFRDYKAYNNGVSGMYDAQMLFSAMANHVANTAISIIEYEKVNQGDPAQYKYVYNNDKDGEYKSEFRTIQLQLENGTRVSQPVEVKILKEKHSDKIKRAGSQMSPGDEIRLGYTEDEIEDDEDRAYLNSKNFTNLTIGDFIMKSKFLESDIIPRFERQLMIDYIRTHKFEPIEKLINERIEKFGKDKYDVHRFIQDIYSNNHGTADEVKKIFKDTDVNGENLYQKAIAEPLIEQQGPYEKINVSDAQVFLRPAFYRKIRKGLGKWNDDCEEAYNILLSDDDWMNDVEKCKIVSKLELYPLKLTYFNNQFELVDTSDPNSAVNRTILNKQACFPLFKHTAQSDTGRKLYNRMNKAGQELDAISFESAVKVGAAKNAPNAYDENNGRGKVVNIGDLGSWVNKDNSKSIDYSTDTVLENSGDDVIPVVVQDITFLRYQLNTQSHEADSRAIGTQVFKIMYQNLFDDDTYGLWQNNIKQSKGSNIKSDLMACINTLTQRGVERIQNELFEKNKKGEFLPSDKYIHNKLKKIAESQNLGITAESILNNGFVAECISSRTLFEYAVSAYVNDEVISIPTRGGTAVQQSLFGFTDYTDNHEAWSPNYINYNNGKPLNWHRDDGSIEVMLTMNFFRHVIPDYDKKSYKERREWLIENDIIGGTKKDGSKSKPSAFGIGYRIPTQGLSSAFAITVMDVLPEENGDLIILPPEITSQTGSDYDVDKIFIATLNYKDGKLVNRGDIDNELSLDKKIEAYRDWTTEEIQNKLLFDYLAILQDPKSYASSRRSLDVIVNKVHDDFLDRIRPANKSYRKGMYELLPSFQSNAKLEFKTGKDGISPFALAITHLTLMQQVHLSMNYGDELSKYGFGELDEIYTKDKDGTYIADWLSAMVSAHVDVAKDPYVFILNLNNVTYNHATFLLRAGMGLSTFSFLAQPILKEYTSRAMQLGGIYGRMITGSEVEDISSWQKSSQLRKDIIKNYITSIDNLLATLDETEENKQFVNTIKTQLIGYRYKISNSQIQTMMKNRNNGKAPEAFVDKSQVFNTEKGIKSIRDIYSSDVKDRINALMFNLMCLQAFTEIAKPAKDLSKLVMVSRIDTEGFGNTIQKQQNFGNRILDVWHNSKTWYIRGASQELNETPGYAMSVYFEHTFLWDKFQQAHNLTKQILRRQLLTATTPFSNLYKEVSEILNGKLKIDKVLYKQDEQGNWRPQYVLDKDGSKKYVKDTIQTFKPYSSEDTAQRVAVALDNIARFNIMMNSANATPQHAGDPVALIESNKESGKIDISFGGDLNKALPYFAKLMFGSANQESLPNRISKFIKDVMENPDADYAQGIIANGEILNDFLLYLSPLSKTKNVSIDRLFLNESVIRTADYKKEKLIADFAALLKHQSSIVRDLARDIVIYGYYTSYDTAGRNNVFSLVPELYRSLYDSAITGMIKSSNRAHQEELLRNPLTTHQNMKQLGSYYADVLCRNYWFDDNIVPSVYENNHRNEFKMSSGGFMEFRPDNFLWKDKNSGARFYGLIVTRNFGANEPDFVKITKKGVSVLYKKVGHIIGREVGKEDVRNRGKAAIYMATQKAGLQVGGTRYYEFYKNSNIPSIFQDNKLPGEFNEREMWEYLYNLIDKDNEKLLNEIHKKDAKGELKEGDFVGWILDEVVQDTKLDDSYKEAFEKAVYSGKSKKTKVTGVKALDGTAYVDIESKPSRRMIYYSNFIVSFDGKQDVNKESIPQEKLIDVEKAFGKNGQLDIESILASIKKFSDKLSKQQKESKNIIGFNITEDMIPISESDKDDIISRSIGMMMDSAENISDEDLDAYIKSIENQAEDIARLVKMYQLTDFIISSLVANDVNVERIVTTRTTPVSRAVLTAAYSKRDLIGTKSAPNSQKSIVFITKGDKTSDTYESWLDMVNSGIEAFVYDVDFSQQHQDAIQETVEKGIESIQEVVEEKKAKVEERVEQAAKEEKPAKTSKKESSSENSEEKPDIGYATRSQNDVDAILARAAAKYNKPKANKSENKQAESNDFVEENGNKPNDC